MGQPMHRFFAEDNWRSSASHVAVIGAGMGGLAAAVRLAVSGHRVTVFEQHSWPGGKMRTLQSEAGPVDAGPTVLTLRHVLDDVFETAHERLDDHLTLVREPILARHFWPGSASLDLFDSAEASAAAIEAFSGAKARRAFEQFFADTHALYRAFAHPIMWRSAPSFLSVLSVCLKNPSLLAHMAPGKTLYDALLKRFDDPRLAQLFARYATYVGGSPVKAPALLSLIWQAEAQGVWRVEGGMAHIAQALEKLAVNKGAVFHYNTAIGDIEVEANHVKGVVTNDGRYHKVDAIIFNGDPAAIARGSLGAKAKAAVQPTTVKERALSAYVWSFAARPEGVELQHNNVFFNDHYPSEFEAIARGEMPASATLYVCAQDRGEGLSPRDVERFEIIMNGAPITAQDSQQTRREEEATTCQTRTFEQLRARGLSFDQTPGTETLTTPSDFAALFPGSDGSLYGQSPNGTMSTFQRPVTQTRVKGLFLAGGGVHPGAGVPMALTSGKHAAAATAMHLASTSTSHQTVMPGGISMGSQTMAKRPSLSSDL